MLPSVTINKHYTQNRLINIWDTTVDTGQTVHLHVHSIWFSWLYSFILKWFSNVPLISRFCHVCKKLTLYDGFPVDTGLWGKADLYNRITLLSTFGFLTIVGTGKLCNASTARVRSPWQFATCMLPTCSRQCHWFVYQWTCHVLSCLCDNACKRSLAIFRKSRVSCSVSGLPSVLI